MMDMSSILDATLTFIGTVAVLVMGIWPLSEASTTVSTTSVSQQDGASFREVQKAA